MLSPEKPPFKEGTVFKESAADNPAPKIEKNSANENSKINSLFLEKHRDMYLWYIIIVLICTTGNETDTKV